jgi:hypothetical protein
MDTFLLTILDKTPLVYYNIISDKDKKKKKKKKERERERGKRRERPREEYSRIDALRPNLQKIETISYPPSFIPPPIPRLALFSACALFRKTSFLKP